MVVVAWLLAAVPAASGVVAASTWKIGVSPSSMSVGAVVTFKVTFSNLGGPSGDDDLGCVRITLPSAFKIILAGVTTQPDGTLWTASTVGQTVSVFPPSGGDRLPPDDPFASVTASITVTSLDPGQYVWTATAYASQGCKEPFDEVASLGVDVIGKMPVATPTPTPTPRPTPTPGPTPTPTPTATSTPSATPPGTTPSASATSTRRPEPEPSASRAPAGSTAPAPTDGGGAASPSPPIGAGIAIPGMGDGGSDIGGGPPAVSVTSSFASPFGEGFEWAVPGLVLSLPGLLLVLAVIGVQALSAFAWLPVVRRRIGVFGFGRRSLRSGRRAGQR